MFDISKLIKLSCFVQAYTSRITLMTSFQLKLEYEIILLRYCSDFRYESNGIFVLGVGFFFLQTNFDLLSSYF